MNQEAAKRIVAVQDAALVDEEYQNLLEEHEVLSPRFLRALEEMEPRHRDAVMDYMGLGIAMHLRLLEMACLWGENI